MTQARVGNAHPSRAAFISKTNNVDSTEQIRMVLKDLVEAVQFRSDSNDGTGNAKVNLAQSSPVATIVNTCRVALSPLWGMGDGHAISPVPKPIAMVQGTINQDIPAVSPAVGSDNATPTVQMAIRGFNNHALTSADGYLPDATYSAAIPSQELHFTVNVGGSRCMAGFRFRRLQTMPFHARFLDGLGTEHHCAVPHVTQHQRRWLHAPTNLVACRHLCCGRLACRIRVPRFSRCTMISPSRILANGLFRLVSRAAGRQSRRRVDTVGYNNTLHQLMQYSPPIPFVDATQNNVAHPNALKPGSEFVRLTMYTGERDPVPTWPWPTYTWGIADGSGTRRFTVPAPTVG